MSKQRRRKSKRLNGFQLKQMRLQNQKVFYHITPVEDYKNIMEEGLKCNEFGQIFFMEFTNGFNKSDLMDILCHVANNQVFTGHFALIQINPKGINSSILPDHAGEATDRYQRYIEQDIIENKHVQLVGVYESYETSSMHTPTIRKLLHEKLKCKNKPIPRELQLSKKLKARAKNNGDSSCQQPIVLTVR